MERGIDISTEQAILNNKGWMLGLARRLVQPAEDAEDVFQAACLKVHRHLGSFEARNNSSLATWICRIVYNEAFEHLRRRRIQQDLVCRTDVEEIEKCTNLSLAGDRQIENKIFLANVLKDLQDDQRQVLFLRFTLGLTNEEASQILGIEENLLRVQLSRLRTKLKNKYFPLGESASAPR
jgi:RNA polymerase sigma-70 factor, ECF subfamily